jgi:hypothetical protein
MKYEMESSAVDIPKWNYWYDPDTPRGGRYTIDRTMLDLLPNSVEWETQAQSFYSSAIAKGATAVKRSNPTSPHVDLPVALGELVTEGLPSIMGTAVARDTVRGFRRGPLSSSSSEYLNYQFGWLPLVSDVRRFAKTVMDSENLIRNYERGSGKSQRRSLSLPVEIPEAKTRVKTYSSFYPTDTATWNYGSSSSVMSYEGRMWFVGSFRYYVPPSGLARYATLARKLYGARLTPDVLWELAPWSWCLDWFGNVGDVISNASSIGSDSVVMEYGYMMHEQTVRNRITTSASTQPWPYPGSPKKATCSATETLSIKTRAVANPYGFSVDAVSLTPKQLSILAAIGLSR